MLMRPDLAEVVDKSEVLVMGSSDPQTIDAVWRLARPGQSVVDLVGLPKRAGLRADLVGLCW
jgi:hypothetical protein